MWGRITNNMQCIELHPMSCSLTFLLLMFYSLEPKRMFKEGAKLVEDVYKQVMGKK